MADASSVRKASALPSGSGRNASNLRFSAEEFWGATGTNYVPFGREVISTSLPTAAENIDQPLFIAPRAYKIVSVQEAHGTAGGASAGVIIKKCTGTQAPSAGTAVHTGSIDLTATANTVVAATLSATAADYTLAAGDRLCADFSGTIAPLGGSNVTIVLRAI